MQVIVWRNEWSGYMGGSFFTARFYVCKHAELFSFFFVYFPWVLLAGKNKPVVILPFPWSGALGELQGEENIFGTKANLVCLQ